MAPSSTSSVKTRSSVVGSQRASDTNTNNDDSQKSFPHEDSTEKGAKIRRTETMQAKFFIIMVALLLIGVLYTSDKEKGMRTVASDSPTLAVLVDGVDAMEQKLAKRVAALEKIIRDYKEQSVGIYMETDPTALKITKDLQHWTKKLLVYRYGDHPFRVVLDLEFPTTIPDYEEEGKAGQVTYEMAPIDVLPCSVFFFLETARTWRYGAFERNSNHVLQASAHASKALKTGMPVQEYSPTHPHERGTTGFAGRPGGPEFYISLTNNTKNHGPGSQQDENPYEADSRFGHVVQGWEDSIPRIQSTPQKKWLDEENQIQITKMTILYNPNEMPETANEAEWLPWKADTDSAIKARRLQLFISRKTLRKAKTKR